MAERSGGLALSVNLHLFFATETKAAVIIREAAQPAGPLWRMIGWNCADNSFHFGQWMQHMLHLDKCVLSPDGAHFLYFAVDGKWDRPAKGAYTVISKVPHFDALALYPDGDPEAGGGYFVDDQHYVIQGPTGTPDIVGKAPELKRVNSMQGAAMTPRAARGFSWRRKVTPPRPHDYVTSGGQLLQADGTLIRDFTEMDLP